MSNSAAPLLFGSSESSQKNTLQCQANKNEVYYMSIPGSRNQKFENSKSSSSAQAAINQETPNISNSEGAAPSMKLNQATAVSETNAVPAQTASLPKVPKEAGPQCLSNSTHDVDALKMNDTATTTSISLSTQTTSLPVTTDPNPAAANDIANKSMVNHEQSIVGHDKKQSVCKRCEGKFEKEENTGNVEEWLHSDMCTNCQKDLLNHHHSISSLQNPKHHKTATTNYHEEEVNSCCCF